LRRACQLGQPQRPALPGKDFEQTAAYLDTLDAPLLFLD
jgi:hypothetical protein